ncbi:hypothetical protein IFM89_027128, partial [Coptis chinensis]
LEEIINEDHGSESGAKLIKEIVALASESVSLSDSHSSLPVKRSKESMPREKVEVVNGSISEGKENKHEKCKRQVGSQSMEIFESKGKSRGKTENMSQHLLCVFESNLILKLFLFLDRRLETLDDFGDEVMDKDSGNANLSNGRSSSMHSTKLLKVVAPKLTKLKGPYYCGVGADKAFGCDIVDSHYKACLLCRYQH